VYFETDGSTKATRGYEFSKNRKKVKKSTKKHKKRVQKRPKKLKKIKKTLHKPNIQFNSLGDITLKDE